MSALATLPPPTSLIPERTYTASELAALFQVNCWTIRYWAKTGVLPEGRRFGRMMRWTPADIAPLLAEREA